MTSTHATHFTQRRALSLALVASGLLPGLATAQAPAPSYVAVCDVDLWRILPAPPEPGSAAQLADLEDAYALQAKRTPAQELDANRHANLPLADWAGDVLGHSFSSERYPLAAPLLGRALQDLRAVNRAANAVFGFRKRPIAACLEPQAAALLAQFGPLKPSLDMSQAPPTSSYPSANGSSALVQAALLAQLFPQHAAAFAAKGEHAAQLRVIGGAHFASDLRGSRALVAAYFAALRRNARWNAEFEPALKEARQFG